MCVCVCVPVCGCSPCCRCCCHFEGYSPSYSRFPLHSTGTHARMNPITTPVWTERSRCVTTFLRCSSKTTTCRTITIRATIILFGSVVVTEQNGATVVATSASTHGTDCTNPSRRRRQRSHRWGWKVSLEVGLADLKILAMRKIVFQSTWGLYNSHCRTISRAAFSDKYFRKGLPAQLIM